MIGMFLLISCRGDDEIGLSGVRFKMNICRTPSSNERILKTYNKPDKIVITISNKKKPIIENKVLSIKDLNSQILYLKPGDYYIKSFLVKNKTNDLIYAAPICDSPMSKFVDVTLPLKFTIKDDENLTISVDVCPLEITSSLKSYGYNSMGFRIVEVIKFELTVQKALGQKPISSHVKIIGKHEDPEKKDRVLVDADLSAKVYYIAVSSIYDKFEIHATSHGYLPQTVEKTFMELKRYVPSLPHVYFVPLRILLIRKGR